MAVSDGVSCGAYKRWKKLATKDKIFYVFVYAFFVLFAVIILYPLFNWLAYSFNDSFDAVTGGIYLIPRKWSLRNYIAIFEGYQGVIRGLVVTTIRTVIGTVSGLAANAMLAFILSRKRFLFKSSLSLFWIFTLYASGGIIPVYILYRFLHLHASFWVYIIPTFVSVINVIVIRTYMQSIPDSFEEAAQLEGAGYIKVFWNIISPLCKPVYAATALFVAAYHWNSWFDALLYNRFDIKYSTIMFEAMKLFSEISPLQDACNCRAVTPYTVKAGIYLLASLPLIIAFPFFQKYFVTGLTVGGIKE